MLNQALQIYKLSEMLAQGWRHHTMHHNQQRGPESREKLLLALQFLTAWSDNVGTCSTENPFLLENTQGKMGNISSLKGSVPQVRNHCSPLSRAL